MTNQEMILAYNGIMQFQNMEQKKFEESGKKILSGKIQLAFSINKNKAAIVQALQPYEETKKSIIGRKSKKLQRQKNDLCRI